MVCLAGLEPATLEIIPSTLDETEVEPFQRAIRRTRLLFSGCRGGRETVMTM